MEGSQVPVWPFSSCDFVPIFIELKFRVVIAFFFPNLITDGWMLTFVPNKTSTDQLPETVRWG